jgi:hypothetical protein
MRNQTDDARHHDGDRERDEGGNAQAQPVLKGSQNCQQKDSSGYDCLSFDFYVGYLRK